VDELDRALAAVPPVPFCTITGGEPFLRADLGDVLATLVARLHPLRMAVPTSGCEPERVAEVLAAVLPRAPEVRVAVKVSLDGLAADHDAHRGRDGLYRDAAETLSRLAALAPAHPNLTWGVIYTLTTANEARVVTDLRAIAQRHQPPEISICYQRPAAGRRGGPRPRLASYRQALEAAFALRRSRHRWWRDRLILTYKGLVGDAVVAAVAGGARRERCQAGRAIAVLGPDLRLYPCEPRTDRCLGSLREEDFRRLWRGPAAAAFRRAVDRDHCRCTNECHLQNDLFFSHRGRLRLLAHWFAAVATSR